MKPFRTLAIDTSTRAGSVALLDEEGRVEEAFLDAAAIQGRALAPCMEALLRSQGIGPDAVDLVAVGLGPGSYTGLRVSIARGVSKPKHVRGRAGTNPVCGARGGGGQRVSFGGPPSSAHQSHK